MTSPWTAQIDAQLKQYIDDGLTYVEIATLLNQEFDLGLTKNACIGRGRRLKVGLRITPPKKPTVPEPEPPWKPFTFVFLGRPKPRPGEIGIENLTPDTCRWPHGEHPPYSYCGKKPYQGGPYCQHHAEISYPGITKRFGVNYVLTPTALYRDRGPVFLHPRNWAHAAWSCNNASLSEVFQRRPRDHRGLNRRSEGDARAEERDSAARRLAVLEVQNAHLSKTAMTLVLQKRKLRDALDRLVHASLYKDHPDESNFAMLILRETQ